MNAANGIDHQQPRRVVVLGAGGFLGAAMTNYLSRLGHDVVAVSRSPNILNRSQANVTVVAADIRDTWTIANAMDGADVVYHFASSTHPSLFFEDPASEYSEAMQPLIWLMEIAAKKKIKKFVYPSSGGTVYADSDLARTESFPTAPRSPYAIFKLASEQLLQHASRQGQFAVDIFRVGNPYGPGQIPRPGQGVVAHWVNAIANNQPIRLFGDGSARRDYIYIDDLCELLSISCHRITESDLFNLGSGKATSLGELLDQIQSLLPSPHPVEHIDARASDIHSIALRPDRLLEHFPQFKFTSLSAGLKSTIESITHSYRVAG